jgi:adenylate cyclase
MTDNKTRDEIDRKYKKLLDAANGIHNTNHTTISNNLKKSKPQEQNKKSVDTSRMVDMMLGKLKEKTIDSDTMIQETQKRVWSSLKQGIEYDATVDRSDEFLRMHVNEKLPMVVMYVDLVGSTDMTLTLPEEKIAIIVSSFAQEMALAIKQYDGFTLKFVGDAVIGYFIHASALIASDNAVSCARSMIKIIDKGINPILNNYDYPDLFIKVGIDYGNNMIVRYGSDNKKSHVDILGPTMNIAAKIQNMAKPQQILIGEDVYTKIHPSTQEKFEKEVWRKTKWKYHDRKSGKLYPVYSFQD